MLYDPRQMEHQELESIAMSFGYLVDSSKQSLALRGFIFKLCSVVSIDMGVSKGFFYLRPASKN